MRKNQLPLCNDFPRMSRRAMLQASGLGLGSLALSFHLEEEAHAAARTDLKPRTGHFRAQASAVIMLVQNGGPSQMDLFDPKPDLKKYHGKVHAEKVEMFQKGSEANKLLASPWKFQRRGRCGMELSEALPYLGALADELCLVRS